MLPIKQNQSLALKTNETRREMLLVPEVRKSLSSVELRIFEASTNLSIKNLPEQKMVDQVNVLLNYLPRDLGIKQALDPYEKTRFFDVLRNYYSDLTLTEVKMAFELSLVGELDGFLPKNGNGEPDKNHYQQFSVEYISKILQAYRRKKRTTMSKAYIALPAPIIEFPEEQKVSNRKHFLREFYYCFLSYKYRGILRFNGILDYLIFLELIKIGFIDNDLEPTEIERKRAYFEVMEKAAKGRINKYEALLIETGKFQNVHIETQASTIARTNRIKQIFDFIIREEIQIINLLKV